MSEAGLLRLRGGLGWLAAALLLCAGRSLVDYFIDAFRTGPNTCSLLPGGAESLSGPLPPDAADASAMLATIDRPGLGPINGMAAGAEFPYAKPFDKKP